MSDTFVVAKVTVPDVPNALVDRSVRKYSCFHPRQPGVWAELTYAERIVTGRSAFTEGWEAEADAYFDSLEFE
jgi:hypothetical protein